MYTNVEPKKIIILVNEYNYITLQQLKSKEKHTKFIQKIRTKFQGIEKREWRAEFKWEKSHAGHRGNEMADQDVKEAERNKNIEECYIKIPKSVLMIEQKEQSGKWRQREWTEKTNGAITKAFFPKIEDSLKFRINVTPNFTATVKYNVTERLNYVKKITHY